MNEIFQQIRDTPKKATKRFRSLLKKLEKFGVELNSKGEIEFKK